MSDTPPPSDPARLNLDDIADMLGISVVTVRGYSNKSLRGARGGAGFPPPDGYTVQHPHNRPWWYVKTIALWVAKRPGHGGRRPRTKIASVRSTAKV